jgi:hypothetical protein
MGGTPVVTDGHRRAIAFMATPMFRSLVETHRAASRGRGTVYFRPTDEGLVRIALHPAARAYVGFRTHANDDGHVITDFVNLPTLADTEARFAGFERWLPSVKRTSDEERGVIAWLAPCLERGLALPDRLDLGAGWVFLHHEWRFASGGKCDILAVHLPSERLGIIECKSDRMKLDDAREEVDEYERDWLRDAAELAPFFTALLRAMGSAYGNDLAAMGTVVAGPAELFVGVAAPRSGVRVMKR